MDDSPCCCLCNNCGTLDAGKWVSSTPSSVDAAKQVGRSDPLQAPPKMNLDAGSRDSWIAWVTQTDLCAAQWSRTGDTPSHLTCALLTQYISFQSAFAYRFVSAIALSFCAST